MQITNLTSDQHDLPGVRLHANETISFDVARYTGDDTFRIVVNTLYANDKISVASTPPGFPIQTAYEVEIAGGEVPGAGSPGGEMPGVAIVRGPFLFAFDTPGIADGVAFYTPTVDDILLDAWFEIAVAFNGTTPRADIAQTVAGGNTGIFASFVPTNPIQLDAADTTDNGPSNNAGTNTRNLAGANFNGNGQGYRVAPAHFTTADPLLVFVSDDGTKGGTPVGGSAGSARLYIVTATPAAF